MTDPRIAETISAMRAYREALTSGTVTPADEETAACFATMARALHESESSESAVEILDGLLLMADAVEAASAPGPEVVADYSFHDADGLTIRTIVTR